jgi:DNA-binding LytR/AlgR family response regulator
MHCIIVDDEPIARKGIQNLLLNHPDLNIIANCESIAELKTVLEKTSVDLIFLDINMPAQTGLDYLQKLEHRNFGVIITTAYPQYALEGYELNVLDYLVKPIQGSRFDAAVEKAKEYHFYKLGNKQSKDFIFIKCDKVIEKIAVQDILYIEAMRNYVIFFTSAKRYIHYSSFKAIELKMNEFGFIKVQKSFIVNTEKITSFNTHYLFINDVKIPVSRDNKLEIIQSIKDKIITDVK